ncbi:MAG: hypothetical protein ACE5EF_00215 [Dehalococcoidia bacterium]
MTLPEMPDMPDFRIPDPLGVRELNLGDLWRARWVEEEPLPRGVRIEYAYATVLLDGKGYLCRPRGSEQWDAVEGRPEEGVRGETWIRRACRDRIGAEAAKVELIGFLDCRATSHNPPFEPGAEAVIPFYTVPARRVAMNPRDAGFERRRLPLNEYGTALRRRYPQYIPYFSAMVERYVILQAQGEVG